MAVVKGHAIRRREGLAPNTLVMAQEGSPYGVDPTHGCPIKGCVTRSRGDADEAIHLALKHPRHPLGAQARAQLLG